MVGVIETLRIIYAVDVVDKATKPLLASQRTLEKSTRRASGVLAQQDAAYRRSASVATSTAARKSSAHFKSSASATRSSTQISRALDAQSAAERRATAATTAEVAKRSAARQREIASAKVSATRVAASSATPAAGRAPRGARRPPGGVVSTAGGTAASARSNVGIAAAVAGAFGISQAVKFDKALRNVNSIAGLTEKQLQKIRERLLEMAPAARQTPLTLAEGMYDLVSSNFDAAESLHIIEKAAYAASAGMTTTDVATQVVAASLNAYKLDAKDAGMVSDILFKTVDRGVISFEQLAQNLGPVLPAARQLGVELEEVGAAAATMTKQGIPVPETMTSINAAMTALSKPSKAAQAALKELGVKGAKELIDKAGGLQGALEALVGTTDGSAESIGKLFSNERARRGVNALVGDAKGAREDVKELRNEAGATKKAFEEQGKSTSAQMDTAKANAQALGITVGTRLLPALNSAIKAFTDMPGPVKIAIAAIAGTALVIGPINKLRKNVLELGGSIVSVGRRAAKSNIAAKIAQGAAGAGGKIRSALSGVGGVVSRLMGRAGRTGGTALADTAAAGAGAQVGPALTGKKARFAAAGRSVGRALGRGVVVGAVAGVALIATDLEKAISKKISETFGGDVGRTLRDQMPGGPLANAGRDWLRKKLKSVLGFRGGGVIERARRYQEGGLVPIAAAGGELLVDGARATMIGGAPDRDGTLMFARPGSAVLTADGQARMAMGASLTQAVRDQAPHFAKGGTVKPGKYVSTSYGPPWGGINGTGVTATGVNLKSNPKIYGIATDPRAIPLGSKVFTHPNPFGYTGRFSAFDTGGAIKGNRIDFYDWRGRQRQLGWGKRTVNVSRSRIAPKRDGEDTYRAPGGGGAETSVSILGKARRRAGLLDDAFSQGQTEGQAGLTLGAIRREGNPVLRAIQEAIRGAGTLPDKGGAASKAKADELTDLGSFKSGTRLARMHAKAAAIDRKRYQYAWGGGHGKIGVPTVGSRTPRGGKRGLGYDCSGAVSAVLGAGGLLGSPLTSGGLMNWGHKGSGKNLAVYTDPGHVIMRIGRKFWGTGEQNPNGGAGWLTSNTMKGRGVTRTIRNMRAGGIVGYRSGGKVGEFAGGGAGRERWPKFISLVHRVWAVQRQIMGGGRRKLRDVLVGQTPGESSAAAWPSLGDIIFSPAVPRAIFGKRGNRGYQLNTLVHELAHMGQKRGLSHRESEGGASLFAFRYAPTILGRVGVRPGGMGRDPYQAAMNWVRKHRSDKWVRSGQFGRRMRAGGRVGGYRTGGNIGPRLTTGLRSAMSFAGGSLEALDNIIARSLETRLAALRAQVLARVRKGGPANVVQRLQGVLDMIDSELGRRVGRLQDVVERRVAAVDRGRGAVERALRTTGIAAESSRGLGVMSAVQAAESTARRQNVASLTRALQTATRARNRTAIREVTQQLHDAQDALAESMTRQVELWRDQIRAQGAEAINAAQFAVGWQQTNMGLLETHQRRFGYQDSSRAMTERAQHLQTGVIPALAAAVAGHQFNAQMLAGIGDVDGWRQAIQDAHSATMELASAHADAAELMRDAARRAAQDLVDSAGHGRTMTDLSLQRLELEQRLLGTYESTGGAQGRAEFIRSQILPAIQAEIAALVAQQAVAQQSGDPVLARQIAEALAGKKNEQLQAQLDALQQIADNTEALKEFGGSTAFSYQGQVQTDLDVIRARAGA